MSVLHPGDVTNQVALRVLFLYRGGRRAGRGFDFLLRVIGSDLTQHSIYLDLVFIQQRGDGFPNRHTIVSALVGLENGSLSLQLLCSGHFITLCLR